MYHPDNAQAGDETVVCKPEPPHISIRWTPREVLRRDTLAGTFEHVNPHDYSNDALYLQQALLYEPRTRRRVNWQGLTLPIFFGGLLMLAAFVGFSS